MIRRRKQEMACTEAELRAMTADMVEMHHATFPQMRAALSDLGVALRKRQSQDAMRSSRRRFLATSGGLIVGTMVLAGCGEDDGDTAQQPGASDGQGQGQDAGDNGNGNGNDNDNQGLMLNASLENLAVFAYMSALEAAPKGKFGKTVPDAVAGFAKEAMAQHKEHADAFNAALKNAGGQAFTEPTPALAPTVTEQFGKLDSVPGLAKLALTLENTAAATYTKQMGEFTSKEALSAIATIAPVERQHAAILTYVLGDYPVPDTFVKLDETDTSLGARTTADLKA